MGSNRERPLRLAARASPTVWLPDLPEQNPPGAVNEIRARVFEYVEGISGRLEYYSR
jgi:hypothetical protein